MIKKNKFFFLNSWRKKEETKMLCLCGGAAYQMTNIISHLLSCRQDANYKNYNYIDIFILFPLFFLAQFF